MSFPNRGEGGSPTWEEFPHFPVFLGGERPLSLLSLSRWSSSSLESSLAHIIKQISPFNMSPKPSATSLYFISQVQNSFLTVSWDPPSSYTHFRLRIGFYDDGCFNESLPPTSMTTITITSLDRCDDSSHCTTMKEEVLDINSSITHFDPVASR